MHTKQRRGAKHDRRRRSRCTSSSTTARTSRPSPAEVQRRVADYLEQMADVTPGRGARRRRRRPELTCRAAAPRGPDEADARDGAVASATSASGGSRAAAATIDKDRWMEKVELDFGAFGTVYYDGDGRVLGSMQYGPAAAFPRAQRAAGRAALGRRDPRHVRVPRRRRRARGCCSRSSWPRSARRATGARARSRRSRTATPRASRRTSASRCTRRCSRRLPRDFGFDVLRAAGRVGLSRLDLGGLQPVAEGSARRCCASSRRRSAFPKRCRRRGPRQSALAPK